METHKINGIELLMPQVPKEASEIGLGITSQEDKTECLCYFIGYYEFVELPISKNSYTILGTCWIEGDKLVCEGFDPYTIFEFKVDFENWLGRNGITIPEGFKRVIIKVN